VRRFFSRTSSASADADVCARESLSCRRRMNSSVETMRMRTGLERPSWLGLGDIGGDDHELELAAFGDGLGPPSCAISRRARASTAARAVAARTPCRSSAAGAFVSIGTAVNTSSVGTGGGAPSATPGGFDRVREVSDARSRPRRARAAA